MAGKIFQVGCPSEESLTEMTQFMQEQNGNTNGEKLIEIFRLARIGAIQEGSEYYKDTAIFKKHLDSALKIYDGMVVKVAGMDKVIEEKVTAKTERLQKEIDDQKAKMAEARDAIAIRADLEKKIANLEDQNQLYKKEAERIAIDEKRLQELEKITTEQEKQLEKSRLDLAVLTTERDSKISQIEQQEKQIAELKEDVRKEREQTKIELKSQAEKMHQDWEAKISELKEQIEVQRQEKEQAKNELKSEREQTRNELQSQAEKMRQDWEAKIGELKQGHAALVESLKTQIETQKSQIATLMENSKTNGKEEKEEPKEKPEKGSPKKEQKQN